MDWPFFAFLGIVLGFSGYMTWMFWEVLMIIARAAAESAKANTVLYIRGAVYVIAAAALSFKQTFSDLTPEMAEHLNWWGWTIYFIEPIAAAFLALGAFLDRAPYKQPDPVITPAVSKPEEKTHD